MSSTKLHTSQVIAYQTVAELKAAGIPAGSSRKRIVDIIEQNPNTGKGGRRMWWNPTSTATPDDVLYVNPTGNGSTGRYETVFMGPALATWWGAVGNDSADDTAGLQAAITWATTRGGELYIPEGIYRLDESLTIPELAAGFKILGASRIGTVLKQTQDNVPCISFVGDLANNFELGCFTLSHTNPQVNPTLNGCGIYYDLPGTTGNGVFNAHYHDIFFVNCGRLFMSNPGKSFPVWGSVFERIYSQRGCTGTAFYFRPAPAQGQPNNCFRDCYFFGNNVLPTEFVAFDTNAQDSFEIHNVEVNEVSLGAKYARITESTGIIGSIKLETGTYSQGGNVILLELSNSRIQIGHILIALTDITNSTNVFILSPSGGAGCKLNVGNLSYGFTFSRTAPTSGTFTALNGTVGDKIHLDTISNPIALGYSSDVRMLNNAASSTAEYVSIGSMLDPKQTADIGDANFTIPAYAEFTVINYASARTGARTVTIPSNTSNHVFNGLSYTLLVGTASAHTIDFGGVYTFPANKTGSVTIIYRRSVWTVVSAYIA